MKTKKTKCRTCKGTKRVTRTVSDGNAYYHTDWGGLRQDYTTISVPCPECSARRKK